jgi:hypothetical protein
MPQNIYTLQVRAACPVHDGQIDLYDVTIRSLEMIPVEKIIEFFRPYQQIKIYQEVLTLTASTAIGAQVELVGIHSGVTVRSSAP